MPRGDKSAYTDKQKRMAGHIEKGYEKRGLGEKEAERRAWATVNKQTGGGKKGGSVTKRQKGEAGRSKSSGASKAKRSSSSTSSSSKSKAGRR